MKFAWSTAIGWLTPSSLESKYRRIYAKSTQRRLCIEGFEPRKMLAANVLTFDLGGNDHPSAIVSYDHGGFAAIGTSSQGRFRSMAIVRVLDSGDLDPTFVSGGDLTFGSNHKGEDLLVLEQEMVFAGSINYEHAWSVHDTNGTQRELHTERAGGGISRNLAYDPSSDRIFSAHNRGGMMIDGERNLDGERKLDRSYNDNGFVNLGQQVNDVDFKQQKLVFLGNEEIIVLNEDGYLDQNFGSNGSAQVSFDGLGPSGLDAMAVQVNGVVVSSSLGGQLHLARFLDNGTLDPNFFTVSHALAINSVVSMKSSYSGITVAGMTQAGDVYLARFNHSGVPISEFGGNGTGFMTQSIAEFTSVESMDIDARGRIIVAGYTAHSGGGDFIFARYDATGAQLSWSSSDSGTPDDGEPPEPQVCFSVHDPLSGLGFGYWPSQDNSEQLAGDFNGDGLADIINLQSDGITNNWMSLSNGDGTVTTSMPDGLRHSYWGDENNSEQLIGDFNGDGNDDVINIQSNGDGWIAISDGINDFALASSSRTFNPTFTGREDKATQLIADIDGDGDADIINLDASGNHWLMRSNGDGTFTDFNSIVGLQGQTFWDSVANSEQLIGDFNGDGFEDIANIQSDTDGWVALSNGDGSFTNIFDADFNPSYVGNNNKSTQMVGDFNGDGNDDIVNLDSSGNHWLMQSNGDGTFTDFSRIVGLQGQTFWDSVVSSEQLIGDFNGDGHDDIVNVQADTDGWIAFSNGDGTFTKVFDTDFNPSFDGNDGSSTQLIGDFNGDGLADIVNIESTYSDHWLLLANATDADS